VAILAVGWTVTITEQSTTMCTSGEKLNGVCVNERIETTRTAGGRGK
jgi:hypothetical protein